MPAPIAPRPAKPTRSISLNIRSPHFAGCAVHRLDDPEIARAAAEVAREGLAELLLVGIRVLADVGLHRHQEARCAEPALERMSLVEGALERVHVAVG